MPLHLIDNATVNCATFAAWARRTDGFGLAPAALARLAADRRVVEAHLASDTPVYGLNTGLGGNLAYRLKRPLAWDPVRERFVDDASADRFLARPMRAPWVV
jgi:histidine ammonia-lyase